MKKDYILSFHQGWLSFESKELRFQQSSIFELSLGLKFSNKDYVHNSGVFIY